MKNKNAVILSPSPVILSEAKDLPLTGSRVNSAKNLDPSAKNQPQDDKAIKFDFQIQKFAELESTNTLAQKMAVEGASEGLVVVADYQTGGRGKPGREWVSLRGKNLLFSVLIRPKIAVNKAPMITQIACRSVAKVLKAHGITPTIKKPNDVMVGGKKICGVLTESAATQTELHSVVIGIGLNVNAGTEELVPEATSMKAETRKTFDLNSLLDSLLEQLKKDLDELYAARI